MSSLCQKAPDYCYVWQPSASESVCRLPASLVLSPDTYSSRFLISCLDFLRSFPPMITNMLPVAKWHIAWQAFFQGLSAYSSLSTLSFQFLLLFFPFSSAPVSWVIHSCEQLPWQTLGSLTLSYAVHPHHCLGPDKPCFDSWVLPGTWELFTVIIFNS